MKETNGFRIYKQKGWTYRLDDNERTACIESWHIGRCRRFRVPDHVLVDDDVRYTITCIDLEVFNNAKTLRHLVIPDSVIYIFRLQYFPNLHSVYFGRGVKYFENEFFCNNHRLTNIEFNKENPFFKVVNNLILTGDGEEVKCSLFHCSEYMIPEGVREISQLAFMNKPKLTHVHMPESLRRIYPRAFIDSSNLRRIKIPEGAEYISHQCFWMCENLEYIELPSSLKEIGGEMFYECPRLNSLVLWPDSVVDYTGFHGALYDLPADCTIYVPHDLVDDYREHKFWGKFTIRICQVGGRYDCDYDGPLDAEPEGDLLEMMEQLHEVFHEFLNLRKNGPDSQVNAKHDALLRLRDNIDLKIMHLNRRGEYPKIQVGEWE